MPKRKSKSGIGKRLALAILKAPIILLQTIFYFVAVTIEALMKLQRGTSKSSRKAWNRGMKMKSKELTLLTIILMSIMILIGIASLVK